MAEDLLKLLELFDQNSGWFMDFAAVVVALGLLTTLVIHIYRFASGKNDWLGRPIDTGEQNPTGQMALIQLDACRKENEELEKKLALAETEQQSLVELLKRKEREEEELKTRLKTMRQEMKDFKSLYEELDNRYADETYTMSQIMYAADEIAMAVGDPDHFWMYRDDVFINLLDYLINTIRDFREKNPRVAIHVRHPEREDVLIHYAHSTGHSHLIKQYEPPVIGSTAGRAWRTGKPYYVPDVEDPAYEYDRKPDSRKLYRSILSVPIMAGNQLSTRIAVLSVTGTPPGAFDKTEVERVLLFASLLYPLIYMDLTRKEER